MSISARLACTLLNAPPPYGFTPRPDRPQSEPRHPIRRAFCVARVGTRADMEPIPETAEAFAELSAVDGAGLLAELLERAAMVQALVPECVGISLASMEHGVTFTLIATNGDVAVLDGIQYLFGGPCVDAAHTNEATTFERGDTVLDEQDWQQFARATATHSIASTLSLPIMQGGRAVGTVNLYGGSASCFSGFHDALASIFGAWAPGAVTNADLSFDTREMARQAPQKLRDDGLVQIAVGIIAASGGLSTDEARYALRAAAQRAGSSEVALARTVVKAVDTYGDRA